MADLATHYRLGLLEHEREKRRATRQARVYANTDEA
jgi:hypothetical protein